MQLFKTSDLCKVANNTLQYITHNNDPSNKSALPPPMELIAKSDITEKLVKDTLEFICSTYQEDVRNKQNSRLHDTQFLLENFHFYRWLPDTGKADAIAQNSTNQIKKNLLKNIPNKQLFITKYYTKLLTASSVKTAEFNQALYALPFDEANLTLAEAESQKSQLTRFKYTRQQIMQGVLTQKKLAKPLIWLTEDGLHDVLLQGTGVLIVDDKTRYFNVHRNNDIGYDYSIGKDAQARYWYFAEVPSIMGYGTEIGNKIEVKPQVTFAGNIDQLGLGKLIMINYVSNGRSVSQMGILADTGGAFENNLFQLDFLTDSYFGWEDYYQANKHLPDYANTWIMVKK
ncbi:MltA domain-containing protein [Paraglaciecola aquimarina]|uniref:MltA domain-containing protein n=1 Tax=Paraglaciecola aquimarina TaxID=1235557 RepID=A0ABU3SVL5_9ALTE|nr:MltA domain-containing protein [Paraglaciecola aquimarina]MDU0354051.1 MltA domain-containing protein [Paraglaciecola aquimarina]